MAGVARGAAYRRPIRAVRRAYAGVRMRVIIAFLLPLLCTAGASAALVDVDFTRFRDTPVGEMLAGCLKVSETVGPGDGIDRVLVAWSGAKSAPSIRYHGVNADALIQHLATLGAALPSSAGEAYALPNLEGFACIRLAADEVLLGPIKALSTLAAPEWPQATEHALVFTGLATDLKLGDVQERIRDFVMLWDTPGQVLLTVNAINNAQARSLDRWLAVAGPMVKVAAGVGVKKAKFPALLLEQTDISRKGSALIGRGTLSDETVAQAHRELVDTLTKQITKYR